MTHCLPFSLPRFSTLAALLVGLSITLVALEATAAPPAPLFNRFTDNANGTVTDNLTGLVWLRSANCVTVGPKAWAAAQAAVATLASPACGLSDGSTAGQWRLPSRNELQSLIEYTRVVPPLPIGHPFTGVQTGGYYWLSTTYAGNTNNAWYMFLDGGSLHTGPKTTTTYYVWPVRGGTL